MRGPPYAARHQPSWSPSRRAPRPTLLLLVAAGWLLGCGGNVDSRAPNTDGPTTIMPGDAGAADGQQSACGACPGCASQCVAGRCVAPSHQGTRCLDGDVYWIDGCGALEQRRETCAAWQTCVAGACGPSSPSFVHAEGKRLVRDGQELVLKGVNYLPVYFPPLVTLGSAFDHAHYRPEVVEDELAMLQRYGFNLVSTIGISSATPENCAALRDFLDRAQAHHLLVNLYIGTNRRAWLSADAMATMVQSCGLAQHRAIFAYDIAWEPAFGGAAERQSLSGQWQDWLVERYGSLDNADAAFGGGHAMPDDTALCSTSADVRVAAFRRFLDDTISAGYRRVREAIRAVDPNHMIAVRSGYGGNGAQWICSQAPFDMRAGAINLDLISPEGYALAPTDRQSLLHRGGFTTAYADVGKPVFWAEYGLDSSGSTSYSTLEGQRAFLVNVIEMMGQSGANGGALWWFAGTRPQNTIDTEVSDYGIIYDYARYPTSIDAAGSPMRDGWLALCSATPTQHGLYVVHDDDTGASYGCPPGTTGRGSFKPDAASAGAGATAIDPLGRAVESGWVALCSATDDAQLVVLSNDETGESYSCPSGTTSAGRFKVDSVTAGAGATGIGAAGRSIESGWMGLCVRGQASLTRVQSGLSASGYACPAGTTASGRFKPDTAPVFKPALFAVQSAHQAFSPATRRSYDRWVTVDRDRYAGYWKSFDDGVAQYSLEALSGQKVGVRTPCSGTTSLSPQQCVGNTTSNGACPVKCLNAEWAAIEVRDGQGRWVRVSDGQTVAVGDGPVGVRFSVGNTGEGTWLTAASAGGLTGAVRFGCNEALGKLGCRVDLKADVPFLGHSDSAEQTISPGVSQATPVVFQMVAEHVAWFGDQLHVTLTP